MTLKFENELSLGPMRLVLRWELLSYGSCLLVLKRLEAKHFLTGLKAHRARAASVPAISAEMRRRQNNDHMTDHFENEFPELLSGIGELTTLPWANKVQLIRIITGQVYRGLHDNLSQQRQHFDRFRALLKKKNEERHGIQPRCLDIGTMHSWPWPSAIIGDTHSVALMSNGHSWLRNGDDPNPLTSTATILQVWEDLNSKSRPPFQWRSSERPNLKISHEFYNFQPPALLT